MDNNDTNSNDQLSMDAATLLKELNTYKTLIDKKNDEIGELKHKLIKNGTNKDDKKVESKKTKKVTIPTEIIGTIESSESDFAKELDFNVYNFGALLSQLRNIPIKRVDLTSVDCELDEFYSTVIKEKAADSKLFHGYLYGFGKWIVRPLSKASAKAYVYISKNKVVKKCKQYSDTKTITGFSSLWKFYMHCRFPVFFKKNNQKKVYNPSNVHFKKRYEVSLKKRKNASELERKWIKVWNKVLDDMAPVLDLSDEKIEKPVSKSDKKVQKPVSKSDKKIEKDEEKGKLLSTNPDVWVDKSFKLSLPTGWVAIKCYSLTWSPDVFNWWMFTLHGAMPICKHMYISGKYYVYHTHYKIFRNIANPDEILGSDVSIETWRNDNNNMNAKQLAVMIQKQKEIEQQIIKDNELKQKKKLINMDIDEDDDLYVSNSIVFDSEDEDDDIKSNATKTTISTLSSQEKTPIVTSSLQQHNPLITEPVQQQHNTLLTTPLQQQYNPLITKQLQQQHNPLITKQLQQQHNPLVKKPVQQHNPLFAKQLQEQHNPLITKELKEEHNALHTKPVQQQHNPLFKWHFKKSWLNTGPWIKLLKYAQQSNNKKTKNWLNLLKSNKLEIYKALKQIIICCKSGDKALDAALAFDEILPDVDVEFMFQFFDKSRSVAVHNKHGQVIGFANHKGIIIDKESGKEICHETDAAFIANYVPMKIPIGITNQLQLNDSLQKVLQTSKIKVDHKLETILSNLSKKTNDEIHTMILCINPNFKFPSKTKKNKENLKKFYINEYNKKHGSNDNNSNNKDSNNNGSNSNNSNRMFTSDVDEITNIVDGEGSVENDIDNFQVNPTIISGLNIPNLATISGNKTKSSFPNPPSKKVKTDSIPKPK